MPMSRLHALFGADYTVVSKTSAGDLLVVLDDFSAAYAEQDPATLTDIMLAEGARSLYCVSPNDTYTTSAARGTLIVDSFRLST